MATLTEGKRAGQFILSLANGKRSFEIGTVAQGQNLVAGQVVMLSGAKLVAHDGTLDSHGDVVTAAVGIIYDNIDASATGTNADTEAVYVARDAEVKDDFLTYPDESTAGGEKAAVIASLAALGIAVRPERLTS